MPELKWNELSREDQRQIIKNQIRKNWQRDQDSDFCSLKQQFDHDFNEEFIFSEAEKFDFSPACIRWFEFSLYIDKLIWLQNNLPNIQPLSRTELYKVPMACVDFVSQYCFHCKFYALPSGAEQMIWDVGAELARTMELEYHPDQSQTLFLAVHKAYAELNPNGWVKGLYQM